MRRFHILFFRGSSQIPAAKSNIPVQSTGCYSLNGIGQKSVRRRTLFTKPFVRKLSADYCAMFVLLWMWKRLKVVNGLLVDVCGTKCTKFCNKRTTVDKITVKTKYTDGPKFADPNMAAVGPSFKRSMHNGYISLLTHVWSGHGLGLGLGLTLTLTLTLGLCIMDTFLYSPMSGRVMGQWDI